MMERNSFSVLFFLKKTKLLKNGEASVCMRITVNNVRSETNIRKSITPSLWNQAKECSRGKDRKSNDLNKYIEEARINYLAYAPEIAAVMLRRQQASAIISAREKIVEGAVSMVRMALHKLSEEEIVELDEEKKAAMVSNLLVVLCADEAAQPVVNTGTLNH